MTGQRLLIIDDDEFVREVAQTSLEIVGGWEVTTASNGEEGLRAAIETGPDAILLDVMMPGMDGPDVLARLRADPSTREIPVVFMTAKAFGQEVERLESLDVSGVVTKPFEPMELHNLLAALLDW